MSLGIPETGVLLVLFKSKSCGNCRQLYPIFDEIAQKYQPQLKTAVVDIQNDMQSAIEHGVLSVPTIIFFKDKQEIKRLTGLVSKDKIKEVIKKL